MIGSRLVPATTALTVEANLHTLGGPVVNYPEPIPILAMLRRLHPITGATVEAELIAPDGTRQALTLRDDGTAPDRFPEDGRYAGVAGYSQDGTHILRVRFTNPTGAAREMPVSGLPLPPPPGERSTCRWCGGRIGMDCGKPKPLHVIRASRKRAADH